MSRVKLNSKFVIYRPDDEKIEVHLNGQYVGSANHDTHGWEGMSQFESVIERVGEILNIEVETSNEDPPDLAEGDEE